MATISLTERACTLSDRAGHDQRVVMPRVGWDGYQAIVAIQGDRNRPQLVYLDGDLFLMSPARFHEWLNDRLGTFVREVVVGLVIPCIATREQKFRRDRADEEGVQLDDSFYLANHAALAAKTGDDDIDLRFDPPPVLVIEVVNPHPATHALVALRRFGFPEVWVGSAGGVEIHRLGIDGRYRLSKSSVSLPFLTAVEIYEWAARSHMASTTQWVRGLRRWIQDVFVPRAAGPIH